MPIRCSLSLLLAAVLSASLAPTASAQTSAPPPSEKDAKAQVQTVQDMRNVGTALFSWLTDQVEDADTPEASPGAAAPEADQPCTPPEQQEAGAEKETYKSLEEIDRLPVISYQELSKLLVPQYITAVPEKDGWGHPFEYRLDREHVFNKSIMAIRSAGADGTFSGDRYKLGAFPRAETDQDLVWMDGFFIRWPERKEGKEPQ
jgi:hypothetical protein